MSPPPHAGKARVVDVWADNEEAELARIPGLLGDFPIAVVATYSDLPAGRLPRTGCLVFRDGVYHVAGLPSRSLDYNNECIHFRTRGVRFLQLVLALVNRDGDVALGRVWRFHLAARRPGDERFLVELGVETPARRRADRDRLGRALRACRAVQNTAVTWVTSDGAEDVANLLHCLLNPDIAPLTPDRLTFVRLSRSYFPELYDLRFLAEWRTPAGEEPPLAAARDAGAGPGALLRGFLALMREPTFAERMVGYNGILSGIGHRDTPDIVDLYRISYEERERRFKAAMAQIYGDQYDLEDVHLH